MVKAKDALVYRKDVKAHGQTLTPQQREELVRPYLPTPPGKSPSRAPQKKPTRRKPIRTFLKTQLHFLFYHLIHLVFSIYIRIRQAYHAIVDRILAILYYHHRTPELIQKDVKALSRLPEHLSVLLTLDESRGGLESLMDEVSELSAWCASAGIPILSVYERTGALKSYIPSLHAMVKSKLTTYFTPSHLPYLRLLAPHHPPYSPSPSPSRSPSQSPSASPRPSTSNHPNLTLLLLSSTDGRETLVDLTKTLAEMSQQKKISPRDITTELIDAEISESTNPHFPPTHVNGNGASHLSPNADNAEKPSSVGNGEPDLLIVFGPYVKLDGYPPWQIRLTEIFCVGDGGGDGGRVEYQGFLRGLWRFARSEMRFGR